MHLDYCSIISKERGIEVLEYIEKFVSFNAYSVSILLDTGSHINLQSSAHRYLNDSLESVINLKKLNDVRYINKFLEKSNEALASGGLFIGNVEVLRSRKKRIFKKYPRPLNTIFYFFDFIVKRVFPKFTPTKKLYYFITQGRNRVISEMEVYGRLYSCGFELVESKEIGGRLWFVGKKKNRPAFNTKATYGPLIRLERYGKNHKLIEVYKLRTMYPFSEYLQPYISDKYGLQKGGKFKDDPRVTRVGKFFRKYWIDELPMIVNLCKGELKIFGVRPLSRHYLNLYPEHLKELRSKAKPGLIPPFYADLPSTFEEITNSEETYLLAYLRQPIYTDLKYFFKALYNIVIKRKRSK